MKTILMVIDGCRPDALSQAKTPVIDNMIKKGSCSLNAETVSPPITLPVHFSIFTSMTPIAHNVLTNTGSPMPSSEARSIIDVAKDFGKKTAAFYSWEHFRNLSTPGALDHAHLTKSNSVKNCDIEIAESVSSYLVSDLPDFTFVYLEGTDIAGHENGWMSKEYFEAIENADKAVGVILETLASNNLSNSFNIILQSDHGGVGRKHMHDVKEVMTVLWIAYGHGIKEQHRIKQDINVIDTAPTLAMLMNIPAHHSWQGCAVREVKTNI
ncbi:MAG: alkaline phosphatase family protein [Desulfuromusa sp.]|nr:alkaline phosphatase family protein [Desulfuromusa sp.]